MISFLNINKINREYKQIFNQTLNNLIDSGWFILGNGVKQFEKDFSEYCGTRYCLGVASGLDALNLILKALIILKKINEGDEVIVPSNTYIATVLAITQNNLKPVFVEPDYETYNIDPNKIKDKLSSRTKIILCVHLYGRLCDMKQINSIAKQNDILVIEDSAQSHGAKDQSGSRSGSFGIAAGFSFYPGKNLGCLGDGGAITTSSKDLYDIILYLRNYGSKTKYYNEYLGINSRLDEIQALFLSIKLKNLDRDNQRRIQIAERYLNEINNSKIILPKNHNNEDHVWHLFTLRNENRDDLMDYLNKNKVGSMIHYPVPPHKQKAYSEFSNLYLPISENIHKTTLSIPMDPTLDESSVDTIIKILNKY
jgi:dTDP-4-amino-4,6-dideoxygalactose transaminase